MKRIYKYILWCAVMTGGASLTSCNYLDIVPQETAKEEDAFASPQAALNFLYSCYSYMPAQENSHVYVPYGNSAEIVACFNGEPIKPYYQGSYSASNLGGVDDTYGKMYKGIKQCYMLKDGIGQTPGLSKEIMDDYINQADFLIAYYHSVLLQFYGPIILVKETPDMNTPVDKFLPRSPYDECATWIAQKFQEVSAKLPAHRSKDEYGLATSVAAKALRSRVLLYAASPLFNGNSAYYSDFVNKDGTQLIAQTFDVNKYKIAADAAREAIEFAEKEGHHLYTMEDCQVGATDNAYPKDDIQRQLRLCTCDKYGTQEVLWANTRREAYLSVQGKSMPFLSFGGGYSPTLAMVERFYTENGLPIDEDPEYEYDQRYQTTELRDDNKGEGKTLKLHDKREPRFYAWISFHNGFYEVNTEKIVPDGTPGVTYQKKMDRSNGKGQRWLTQYKVNDNSGRTNRGNNYSTSGYLNKKGVHPGCSARKADAAPTKMYPTPIIRLAELYLNYAEACVGYGDAGYIADGMKKLNEVRKRAGIPDVLDSWKNAKHPLTTYGTGGVDSQLMHIVQRERMIELYMEAQSFWDIRRWKLGEEYFSSKPQGLNTLAATDDEFFKVTTFDNFIREFHTPKNYLMPIPSGQVSINDKMVQNPGY